MSRSKNPILPNSNVFKTFLTVPVLFIFRCLSEEVAGIPTSNEPNLIRSRTPGLLAEIGSPPTFPELRKARSRAMSGRRGYCIFFQPVNVPVINGCTDEFTITETSNIVQSNCCGIYRERPNETKLSKRHD